MSSPLVAVPPKPRNLVTRLARTRSADLPGVECDRSVRHRRASRQMWLLAVLILALDPSLNAQTTSGIFGTVTDQQGLAIAGAEVLVQSAATGVETKFITDSEGGYRAIGLQPGAYRVVIAHDGFATRIYELLNLPVNDQFRLDFMLAVGSIQQKVTAEAAPPLLESGTSSTGSTILPKQVESMPLNGRNYLDLLQLVPGVSINRTV